MKILQKLLQDNSVNKIYNMITIVAKHVILDDQISAYKNLAKELIIETRNEPGCIEYDLFEDTSNENILTFIEEWEDEDAIKNHFNSQHFKSILPKMKPLLASETEVNIYKNVIL